MSHDLIFALYDLSVALFFLALSAAVLAAGIIGCWCNRGKRCYESTLLWPILLAVGAIAILSAFGAVFSLGGDVLKAYIGADTAPVVEAADAAAQETDR